MTFLKPHEPPWKFYFAILLFLLINCSLSGQVRKDKKIKKAEKLLKEARILSDSAKYDSAIVLLEKASLIYKKKNIERYIYCKNEIVIQSRYLKFNDELLNTAKENIKLSIEKLGRHHNLTGNCYGLLGNVYADINKTDSAVVYFKKAKEIWSLKPIANKMKIASANLNIGQMLENKGEFNEAKKLIYLALKVNIDSLGKNHPVVAHIYNALGVLYYRYGDIDSCAISLTKALEIKKQNYNINHPKVADAYSNLGVAYKIKGDLKKALEYYEKALEIRKHIYKEPHPRIALSLSNIGVIYANQGKYELSNQYYEKALKMRLEIFGKNHMDVAACYTNLGINCMDCGLGGSAIAYTEKAFNIIINTYGPDNPNSADAYNNMGAAYVYGLGDLDKALPYFKKGLELRLKTDPGNPSIAGSYNNIGAVYKHKGDYALALSYYNLGLDIILKQFGENHFEAFAAYNNIGEAYLYMDNYDLAYKYFKKSLEIRKKLFGSDYPGLIESYLNLGAVYGKQEKLEEEKRCYDEGLRIGLKNFDENNISLAGIYMNMALNQAESGNYSSAITLLEKALKIQKSLFSEDHADIAKSLSDLGLISSKSGDYKSSLNYNLKALDANYIGNLSEKIDYNYILQEIPFLETLKELAGNYFKKYEKEKDLKSLKNALNYYQKAAEMVAYMVSGYSVEASKLKLLEKATDILDKAVYAAGILYQKQGDINSFELALNFAEQNKASVLYESIIKNQVSFENTSDSLWVALKNIEGRINYLKTKYLQKNSNSDSINSLLSQLVVEKQQIREKVSRKHLATQRTNSFDQELVKKLQSKLKPEEALLEYFVSDNLLFSFIITKDLTKISSIRIDDNFSEKVKDYLSCIKKHRINEFQNNSKYLYDILIKPIAKYIQNKQKVVIIPDGPLLYFPFESLISAKQSFKNETDFTKLNYFVKKHEVVYQYSVNLWKEEFTKPNNTLNSTAFLGIAPFADENFSNEKVDSVNFNFLDKDLPETVLRNVTNTENEYLSLIYSGKEVRNIGELYEKQGLKTKELLGSKANESVFKKLVKDCKYLHIATHGIINNIHPELSGLAFRKSDTDINPSPNNKDWRIKQNTDGVLYSKEIFGLDLNAELVVLSACETGIGKLEKGEGVISLTRGFLYNQVPNIVFSLWKINDKSTCGLMVDFYTNLLQGKTYSSALRQAKLNMIANKANAFPAYWAAFSLIGK